MDGVKGRSRRYLYVDKAVGWKAKVSANCDDVQSDVGRKPYRSNLRNVL